MPRCLQNTFLPTLLYFSNIFPKIILAGLTWSTPGSVWFESMAENNIFKSGLNFMSRQADRVMSPEARNEVYQRSNRFARDEPFTFVSLKYLLRHV